MYSPDFDYRNYLETKSHFDQIEMALDADMKEMIASNELLAEKHLLATGGLHDQISVLNKSILSGFDQLSFNVSELSSAVTDLSAICEFGFAETVSELQTVNAILSTIADSLAHIAEISQSQEQYQALEYYSFALKATQRKMYKEAFIYTDWAISGRADLSGYPFDYRFHELRGKLYMGFFPDFDLANVDLRSARDAFVEASRHASHEDKVACSRVLALAAWCSYCIGDFDSARSTYQTALSYHPDAAGIRFEYARLLIHQKDMMRAKEEFQTALRLDPDYVIRAGVDPLLLQKKEVVSKWVEELRIQKFKKIYQEIEKSAGLDKNRCLAMHKEFLISEFTEATERLKEIEGFTRRSEAGLLDLAKIEKNVNTLNKEIYELLQVAIEKARNKIDEKIIETSLKEKELIDSISPSSNSDLTGIVFAVSFFGVFLVAAFTGSDEITMLHLLLSPFGAAIWGVIIGFVSRPIWAGIATMQKSKIREDRKIIKNNLISRKLGLSFPQQLGFS